MSKPVRAFIAIDLNPKIQDFIGRLQNNLKKIDCDITWVKPENIHITLKFLGDIDQKQTLAIKQAIALSCNPIKPFTINLAELGAFPNINRPRILWIGLKDPKERLIHLSAAVQKALVNVDIEGDPNPFNPHITIGRIRSPKNISLLVQSIQNVAVPEDLTQTISKVILFKSTLSSEGPKYEFLYQKKLTSK